MSRRKPSAFDRCVKSVAEKGSAYDPRAVCASAGRKKYGQAEMTRRAAAGRRRNDTGQYAHERKAEIIRLLRSRRALSETQIQALEHELESILNGTHALTGKRVRANSIESAAALSEAFHGRPAEAVTEYVETLHEHSALTGLGRLLSIKLKDGTEIEFDKATQLASNEAGTQLYAVGGDQSIDLSGFDVDPSKEAVVLGKVRHLDYWTSKHHLGKADKKPGAYTHRLGEESGEMPILMYDTVNDLVSFVGGSYHIDVDMDGKYSAGIRD